MARLRLKYIKTYRDQIGKIRNYFKRPGFPQNVPLPGLPGSAEFMAAYQAALAATEGRSIAAEARSKRPAPGSINALAEEYYASPQFRNLAPITKSTYRNEIERIRNDHGDKPAALLDRRGVIKLLGERADRPGAANQLLRMIRLLMRFAIEIEIRKDDPTARIKKMKVEGDGFVAWSEEDIARFEARHPIGSKARLAFALLLYTAQRRGDVIRMGRQHVRSGLISVRQSKTGAMLDIPLHPDLAAIIEASEIEGMMFLTTQYGKPFSPAGFGNWFGGRCREAGLPAGYNAHGLRKAACRRLAEAGCTTLQIMAISGHKTIEEVETYTRAVDQIRLGREAMSRLPIRGFSNPVF